MDTVDFEKLVDEGLEKIPLEFREKLDNVAIFVAWEPSYEQRRKMALRDGMTLFGLYEGVPQPKRGSGYVMAVPDKITIFQNPIQTYARGKIDIMREMVKNTVWHEIAHHFGMNEEEVRAAEERRRLLSHVE